MLIFLLLTFALAGLINLFIEVKSDDLYKCICIIIIIIAWAPEDCWR